MTDQTDQAGRGRGEKFNAEGYHDPTAHAAMSEIRQEQTTAQRMTNAAGWPLVYVCSPYAGDILNNERKARRYCQYAISKQVMPVASHLLYPQLLDERDPEDRALGLAFGLKLLGKCAQCWVFGRTITPGMAQEIGEAHRLGLKVRYFTEDMEEVYGHDR